MKPEIKKLDMSIFNKKINEIITTRILFKIQEDKLDRLLDKKEIIKLKKIVHERSLSTNEELINGYIDSLKEINSKEYFQKTKDFDLTTKDSDIPQHYKSIFYNIDNVLEELAGKIDPSEHEIFLSAELITNQLILNKLNLNNNSGINEVNTIEFIESFCEENNIIFDFSLTTWIVIISSVYYHSLLYAKNNKEPL